MAYESMKQMLDGVEYIGKPKLLERNTVQYTLTNGDIAIRLHHTDIITKRVNGSTVLNTGGWKTVTTKDRINKYAGVSIHSDKGIWKVRSIPFKDGMVIKKNGEVANMKSLIAQGERDKRLGKLICKYVKQIKDMPNLPIPSAGDCWCCAGLSPIVNTDRSLSSSNHLLQHVKEGYIHGTLIMNALKHMGYQSPETLFMMFKDRQGQRTSICSAVRRYLRHHFGLST